MLINRDQIKLLWHRIYYDGPISGMCLYQEKKHWFDMVSERYEPDIDQVDWDKEDEDDFIYPTRIRTFNLYILSDEQIDYEEGYDKLDLSRCEIAGCFEM